MVVNGMAKGEFTALKEDRMKSTIKPERLTMLARVAKNIKIMLVSMTNRGSRAISSNKILPRYKAQQHR